MAQKKDYLPHTQWSQRIDRIADQVGRAISYIWLILLGVIMLNVLMRYAFNEGRIEMEELQWHLYSIGFLLGLGYAYQADAHIRVDVLHETASSSHQGLDRALRHSLAAPALYHARVDLQHPLRRLVLRSCRGLRVARRSAIALANQSRAATGIFTAADDRYRKDHSSLALSIRCSINSSSVNLGDPLPANEILAIGMFISFSPWFYGFSCRLATWRTIRCF